MAWFGLVLLSHLCLYNALHIVSSRLSEEGKRRGQEVGIRTGSRKEFIQEGISQLEHGHRHQL